MNNPKSETTEKRKMNFLTIALFGIPMGIIFAFIAAISSGDIVLGIITGAIAGPLAGLLFNFILNIFGKSQAKKFHEIRDEIAKEYDILHDGEANHLVNKEGVGGWLFLTSSGLLFKSHIYNFQVHELWIPYETVQSLSTFKNLGFIENGLLLERKDGTQNKFVVYGAKDWVAKIAEMLN